MRVFQFTCITLLIALLAVPASLAQSTMRTSNDQGMTWAYSNDDESYKLWIEGEVTFRPDDSGILSLSRGGKFTLFSDDGRRRIELEVENGSSGLEYDYRVNGDRVRYTSEVERSLASVFLYFIRESGVDAENRVKRFLRAGGPAAVYNEIDEIESGSSVRRYLNVLVDVGDLDSAELSRAARVAEDRIFSSGDLARFLILSVERYMAEEEAQDAYFDVLESVESSGDKARVLIKVLDLGPEQEAYTRAIEVAVGLESSGDKTRVLMSALGEFPDDRRVRTLYFEAVESIDSSGDRSRLLIALLNEYEVDEPTATMAFSTAMGIGSSGDKARVLISAVPQYSGSAQHQDSFFDAVSTIGSSGDHARVLLALLSAGDPGASTLRHILESSKAIGADGDASRVLIASAKYVEDDQVDAYLEAAEKIGNGSDRSRTLRALMDR